MFILTVLCHCFVGLVVPIIRYSLIQYMQRETLLRQCKTNQLGLYAIFLYIFTGFRPTTNQKNLKTCSAHFGGPVWY